MASYLASYHILYQHRYKATGTSYSYCSYIVSSSYKHMALQQYTQYQLGIMYMRSLIMTLIIVYRVHRTALQRNNIDGIACLKVFACIPKGILVNKQDKINKKTILMSLVGLKHLPKQLHVKLIAWKPHATELQLFSIDINMVTDSQLPAVLMKVHPLYYSQ